MMRSTLYVRLSRRACVLVYIRIYTRPRERESRRRAGSRSRRFFREPFFSARILRQRERERARGMRVQKIGVWFTNLYYTGNYMYVRKGRERASASARKKKFTS